MTSTFIDGHVHFHPEFSLEGFLSAAKSNFQNAGAPVGVLLLAQIGSGPPLSRFADPNPVVGWKVSEPDPTSVLFQSNDDFSLLVVSGRQIVTLEKLELLTLCCDQAIPEGQPIRDAIQQSLSNEAVPVVPWGFGKWWFARGKILRNLFDTQFDGRWFVGDNGCRVSALPPRLLSDASDFDIRILAGSDPLPIQRHVHRPGSYGSVFECTIDLDQPTPSLRKILNESEPVSTFGNCRSLTQFVDDQLRLRLSKTS